MLDNLEGGQEGSMKIWARLSLAILSGLMVLSTSPSVLAATASAARQVLIIHSYHAGLSWTESVMDGIREALRQKHDEVQISAEFLDARRYPGHEHARQIREVIVAKLQRLAPDLVIAADNAALEFVLALREQLLAQVPIVFCGINSFTPSMIADHRQITGVAEDVSVAETVALALRLHPGTRELIVLGRTSVPADKANRDSFAAALPALPTQLKISFWDDLPLPELQARLVGLKEGAVVFLNGLLEEESGRQLMYGETTAWVCRHSAAPVYSLWDVYLGYGIVGGKLVSGYRQGQLAGEMARRILRGESADAFPVVNALDANRYIFDFHQLEKLNIPLTELPDGAVVVNRPYSFYQQYKTLVWATVVLVLVLSSLVVLLGLTVVRRRAAEAALRQANLVVENSPVVLFRWKASEGWPVVLVSQNVIQFGYTPEELLSGRVPFSLMVYPEDLERVATEVQGYATAGADQFQQQYRLVTKTGEVRWVHDHTVIARGSDGRIACYEGTLIDITERQRAEAALQESERKFRDLAEKSVVGVYLTQDMAFKYVNERFAAIHGYSVAEMTGKMAADAAIFPEDRPVVAEMVRQRKKGEAPSLQATVFRIVTKKGELRYVEDYSTSTLYQGRPAMIGTALDVTERRQAEEALRQSEGVLRSLLEATPAGVALLVDRVFQRVSPALCRMTGYLEREIIGMKTRLLYPDEETYSRVGRELYENMTKSGLGVLETRLQRKDGELIEVLLCLSPFDPADASKGVTATVLDITERKQAEEETRRLRNYLSNIINSMPSVLVGVDVNGCVTQWNSAAEKTTGIEMAQARGQPLDRVLPMMHRQLDQLRQAMRTRTVLTWAKVPRIVDGELRYEDVTVYPLISNDLEGAVIRVDDVTERVRIEEMMVQSEKMLSVGGLAAGMAHEINNPLGVILQACQNILRRCSPDLPANKRVAEECGANLSVLRRYLQRREILTFLEDIRQSGQRAAEIVANMLSFSRKAEGTGTAVDLGDLLERTVALAASDYDLKKHYDFRQIEIVREYQPGTPRIICQAGKIQQVFLNILRNGAQAMRTGEGTGRAPRFMLRVRPDDAMVRVEIEDNGPGMDEATRKRVFEPFFTTKPPGSGTGLGLSVSYFIITEDHGGMMTVESSPGVGTRFIIRLPAAKDAV